MVQSHRRVTTGIAIHRPGIEELRPDVGKCALHAEEFCFDLCF